MQGGWRDFQLLITKIGLLMSVSEEQSDIYKAASPSGSDIETIGERATVARKGKRRYADGTDDGVEPQKVRDYCFALLARREYSQAELVQKILHRFQLSKSSLSFAEEQVAYLRDKDYQSDERFAQSLARSKASSGQGRSRIRQYLLQKGVAEHIVEQAIRALASEGAVSHARSLTQTRSPDEFSEEHEKTMWLDRAYATWQKKFKYYSSDMKDIAKQKRFLVYRGYSFDEANQVISRAKSAFEEHES